MAKRKRVGLIFSYNENWIGGTYYFLNLINALNILDDKNKPKIIVVSNDFSNYTYLKKETHYKYIEFLDKRFSISNTKKFINKIFKKLNFRKPFSVENKIKNIDMIYQYYADDAFFNFKNKVYWIPDFQEKFYPQYFKQEEINLRQQLYERIANTEKFISFSSYNSLSHFETLFPESNIIKFVIQFAVTHPRFDNINFDELRDKYNLENNFFFSPNQFWEHKNHMIVLKALKILKSKGINTVIAFSGKETDYRNQDYLIELKNYINKNDLSENIRFLGFIPRNEQLLIMKEALSIIQPSLFEGWSTVVEDVKAINNFIILSDIEVHKEQISENCKFFNPNNEEELALIIESCIENKPIVEIINYNLNKEKFSADFIHLINEVTN